MYRTRRPFVFQFVKPMNMTHLSFILHTFDILWFSFMAYLMTLSIGQIKRYKMYICPYA
jgi:hypothetical protein